MNPDEKKDTVSLMMEEKCGEVLRATAEAKRPTIRERNLAKIQKIKVERRAYENAIEERHQKLLTEVKNLRLEISEKDEKIILLSNVKKDTFQVTQKELQAFKDELMEMALVMNRLRMHSKEKDMQSSRLRKELMDTCAEMESAKKQAADTAEELLSLQKTADQLAADLEALRMTADLEALRKTADQSAADLEALRKTADQAAADLEALQALSRKQARCQSQETQTEVVQSCPGPKLILCVHRNKPSNMSCNAYWSVNPACSLVYWGRCVIYFVFFRNVSAKRRKRRVAA